MSGGKWQAYCYVCMGGGKELTPATSKKSANLEAASHNRLYGHHTAVIPARFSNSQRKDTPQ